MSYVSPLHIVAGIADDPAMALTPDNLVRLRKRLLAELNLSGEIGITIHGTVYTKDAIIKTIDLLLQTENLELHEFIYRHTFLLSYLEDDYALIDMELYAKLTIPESIRQNYELLLSERVILQFKKGISSRKFAVAERALVMMNFMESNLRLACYEEVHRSLTALYHFLWELKQTINRHSENDIGFLGYGSLAVFLNALPDSFSELKRNIINSCISIVVVYDSFSDHNHALVMSISNMLLQLECEEEQSLLIRNNHKAFSAFRESTGTWRPPLASGQKTSPAISNLDYRAFLWLIVGIILVSVLGNLASTGERDEHPEPSSSQSFLPMEQSPVAQTISDFRERIHDDISTDPRDKFTYFSDSVYPVTGQSPFKNDKFRTDNVGFKSWNKSLHLYNKTAYDLIIFCFDSLKSSLRTVFISKNDSVNLSFGNHAGFTFYFGNMLMKQKDVIAVNDEGQEIFTKLHTHSEEILSKDYKIILKQNVNTLKEYTLELKPDFLDDPKDEYLFETFTLFTANNTPPLPIAEVMATFPGGVDAIERYIQDKLNYPQRAIDQNVDGKALIRFVVNAQGKVSEASLVEGVPGCPECDEEALRVIKAMPPWTPAMQAGKAVPVFFTIPIHFKIY
jgi:TonB family protein